MNKICSITAKVKISVIMEYVHKKYNEWEISIIHISIMHIRSTT